MLRSHSAQHLADHFAAVPLLLFAFSQGTAVAAPSTGGVGAQLAARARGVGSTLTSVLGVFPARPDT